MRKKRKTALFIFGTRPEAIKLAPLIRLCILPDSEIRPEVCVTSQHREMLVQALDLFNILPDYDLEIMRDNQDLFELTSRIILRLRPVLGASKPDIVIVQGDTTTAFLGALAGFYMRIPVAHIEAGLRTGNPYSPFPEENNRRFISQIACLHFAPTESAQRNLLNEGIHPDSIFVTGNTVIDAFLHIVERVKSRQSGDYPSMKKIRFDRPLILVTGHRRENFGDKFREICIALKTIGESHPQVEIVYPVHLNPQVRKPVNEILSDVPNIYLLEPLDYESFVFLMNRCSFIITDSGGIQEEAPSIKKPVIVIRDTTERQEAVISGSAVLAGTSPEEIVRIAGDYLEGRRCFPGNSINPYGDGMASQRIFSILNRFLYNEPVLEPELAELNC